MIFPIIFSLTHSLFIILYGFVAIKHVISMHQKIKIIKAIKIEDPWDEKMIKSRKVIKLESKSLVLDGLFILLFGFNFTLLFLGSEGYSEAMGFVIAYTFFFTMVLGALLTPFIWFFYRRKYYPRNIMDRYWYIEFYLRACVIVLLFTMSIQMVKFWLS